MGFIFYDGYQECTRCGARYPSDWNMCNHECTESEGQQEDKMGIDWRWTLRDDLVWALQVLPNDLGWKPSLGWWSMLFEYFTMG